MQYVVKYKLYLHSWNKEIEDTVSIENGHSYFDGEMNCSVYDEKDAVHFVRSMHKLKEIERFAKIPEEIYSSEVGEIGATSLKILRTWIG